MDELLPKLKIHQVRTPLDVARVPRALRAPRRRTSSTAPRASPRSSAGCRFTGSGKHFVKYRDATSPLGYDATALYGEPADFVLYADTFMQGYQRVKDVEFAQLVFRLSPRRLPGTPADDLAGSRAPVDRRAHRARALAADLSVAQPRARRGGVRRAGRHRGRRRQLRPGHARSCWRAMHELPARMLALFAEVPGIEVFRPVGDNVVVQVGYRHPLHLRVVRGGVRQGALLRLLRHPRRRRRACASRRRWCRRPISSAAASISASAPSRVEHTPREPDKLEVQLKLVASATARRRVTATMVPWAHADRLRKLVYALPPTMLATYRVAAITEGLFVIGEQGIDGIPIGDMFQEAAPSIYVPLGMEFYPRVGAEVLTDHIGGVNGRYVVFPRGGRPLALEHAAFEPLGRRALARARDRSAHARRAHAAAARDHAGDGGQRGARHAAAVGLPARATRSPTSDDDGVRSRAMAAPLRPAAGGRRRRARGATSSAPRERKLLAETDFDRDESAQRIGEARHALVSELVLARARADARRGGAAAGGGDAEPLVPVASRHRRAVGDAAPPARGLDLHDRAGDAGAARPRARRQPRRGAHARRAPLDAAPPVRPRPRRRARQLLGGQARVPRRRAAVAPAAAGRSCGACARSAGASPSSARRWPIR